MTAFKVGDRVHTKLFRKGVANGSIERIWNMRTETGIPYTVYEVVYDEPVRGPWPSNVKIRREVHSAMALEALC